VGAKSGIGLQLRAALGAKWHGVHLFFLMLSVYQVLSSLSSKCGHTKTTHPDGQVVFMEKLQGQSAAAAEDQHQQPGSQANDTQDQTGSSHATGEALLLGQNGKDHSHSAAGQSSNDQGHNAQDQRSDSKALTGYTNRCKVGALSGLGGILLQSGAAVCAEGNAFLIQGSTVRTSHSLPPLKIISTGYSITHSCKNQQKNTNKKSVGYAPLKIP
jgi:hypothetical protein